MQAWIETQLADEQTLNQEIANVVVGVSMSSACSSLFVMQACLTWCGEAHRAIQKLEGDSRTKFAKVLQRQCIRCRHQRNSRQTEQAARIAPWNQHSSWTEQAATHICWPRYADTHTDSPSSSKALVKKI